MMKSTTKKTEVSKSTTKETDVRKSTTKKTEEPYVAKVKQLAKLKQKQEEDKAVVRLHCFSKACENGKDVGASSEGFKQMQTLKCIDNYLVVEPSDIQGQVDLLFPEVILCVEIYNSHKFKLHAEDGNDVEPRRRIRLVVPNSSYGGIIGKGGDTIK